MAVGQGSLLGGLSYLAVGRETAFGTYNTCTAALDFLSSSVKTMQEGKILEQISTSRTHFQRLKMGKVIEGDIEFYYDPLRLSDNYILQNAFIGTITSATATGETAGSGGFTHTFNIGSNYQSYTSLCINMRKGDSSGGQVFEYSGVRVNEITFASELDEPLRCSVSVIAKDSSLTSNDVASALTVTTSSPLSFASGRLSIETQGTSHTTTSFWHIQSVEFGWNNSLKSDTQSRRIGSDVLDVLPAGMVSFNFTATIRFDTTTAYDAMLNATSLKAELEFLGDTMTGSVARRGIKFTMPRIFVNDAGDPQIGGPDEILTSEVTFHVLRNNTASGYAMIAEVTNNTSSYA